MISEQNIKRVLNGHEEIVAKMFQGKAYIAVPDYVEEVEVVRNGEMYNFTIPNNKKENEQN